MNKIETMFQKAELQAARVLNRSGELEFNRVQTDNGVVEFDGTEPEVGMTVYRRDADGELVIAEDGNYQTETRIITVEAGKIADIKDKEDSKPETEMEDQTAETNDELSAEVAQLRADLSTLTAIVEKLMENTDLEFKRIDKEFKTIVDAPVAKPATEEIKTATAGSQLNKFNL